MKLIFLHIPKAGGTTLHDILERLYAGSPIFTIKQRDPQRDENAFVSLPQHRKNEFVVLKGHMSFGLHTHFQEDNVKYITLFRDPVDRIISHYEYVLRRPKHFLHQQVKSRNMSLEDYALSDLTNELDNHQCRSLITNDGIEINQFGEEGFNLAVENLKKYFISYGIVEEFDKSVLLFRRELGWKQYPYYVMMNTRPDKKSNTVSDTTRAKIEARNSWDVKLYKLAREEFGQRLSKISTLEEELKVLGVASEAFGRGIEHERQHQGKKNPMKAYILRLLGR